MIQFPRHDRENKFPMIPCVCFCSQVAFVWGLEIPPVVWIQVHHEGLAEVHPLSDPTTGILLPTGIWAKELQFVGCAPGFGLSYLLCQPEWEKRRTLGCPAPMDDPLTSEVWSTPSVFDSPEGFHSFQHYVRRHSPLRVLGSCTRGMVQVLITQNNSPGSGWHWRLCFPPKKRIMSTSSIVCLYLSTIPLESWEEG